MGCGDFRVGRRIVDKSHCKYIGVDVVEELIIHNNKSFGNNRIQFKQLNIVRGTLPDGELCLIRQVLQHLSNSDIKKVLKKCAKFNYVIITEHQPVAADIVPNIDKASNAHIRLNQRSGVYLDKAPFNKKISELLTVFPKAEKESKIVTFQIVK